MERKKKAVRNKRYAKKKNIYIYIYKLNSKKKAQFLDQKTTITEIKYNYYSYFNAIFFSPFFFSFSPSRFMQMFNAFYFNQKKKSYIQKLYK